MSHRHKRQRLSLEGAENAIADVVSAEVKQALAEDPPAEAHKDQKHRRQLFVRSLAPTVTTEDLTEHFSQSYPIKHATAVIDPATKQCKGYGFVTFADIEDAQRALEEFNDSELKGRKIRVDIAQPRHRESDPGAAAEEKVKREQEKLAARQPPPRLIVRNLPWTIKKPEQLADLFRSYGKVKDVKLPTKKPGLLAGFGFVTIRGRKNSEKAIEGVNGKELDGRQLAVDWAVDKDTWENLQKNAPQEEEAGEDKEGAEEEEAAQSGGSEDDDDDATDDDEDEDEEEEEDEEDWENDEEAEEEEPKHRQNNNESTLFIRNLPFTCDDEQLHDHFQAFGGVRYARIVMDHATERPRGTGFVCFYSKEDADACLKGAPRPANSQPAHKAKKDAGGVHAVHSILQNVDDDPEGRYTMDGRVLQVTRAVDRNEAARLTEEGAANRFARDTDKRRLYLLSEGTIASNSPLYQLLSPAEITLREASVKQRKQLIQSNPSLHLSLTRLSVRNIPRSVTSKDLKALARQAVVGFAKDVKEGKRQPLSAEERARGGETEREAERQRRARGKGVVKQAKIVFETKTGTKVDERSGAGRSRGYGFVEYYTHRHALMGLRWLNGHAIDYRTLAAASSSSARPGAVPSADDVQDRKKRLLVEFAIENAQVVHRRLEKEAKMREHAREGFKPAPKPSKAERRRGGKRGEAERGAGGGPGGKRKREEREEETAPASSSAKSGAAVKDEKQAKRQQIIARKRMARRTRKKETA